MPMSRDARPEGARCEGRLPAIPAPVMLADAPGLAGVAGERSTVTDGTDRLRAAEVSALYSNVAIGVLGATGAAIALTLSLLRFGAVSGLVAGNWAAYIAACAGAHLILRALFDRRRGGDTDWRFWAGWFTALSVAEGIGWGWGSVFLVGTGRLDLQLLVFVVCFGVAAGAVPTFGSYLPAFLGLFVPATVPELGFSLLTIDGSPQQLILVMLTVVFVATMGGLALRMNANFKAIVGLRIRTEDLAVDLLRQKEVAEEANRAKSAFLAAASHDLRQPVHALSLFVGALRGVALPPEGARLVDQIEASTQALDGLFGALLDLSRLDAGIVEGEPCAFAIDDLLDRICADHLAEAEGKALAIVRLPCGAIVDTDPFLMERILRNLVVNAIRHTRRGRVLVGCRRRAGRLVVEVWDTGRGIAPDQQGRIFDEYVQLDNLERDRVKGLGLGLAIVRRLCALLACPVTVRSRPGRGSCFAVSIPLAPPGVAARRAEGAVVTPAHEQGLILVIDDEPAIQEGMARLLGGWGYATIVSGSGEAMLAKLAECPDVPALILCDYRLPDGERGSAVIERLQSEYNEPIPAILITGDTAPDRLVEAQASGFLLLHKPVPNGKLRAAIGHLIAQGGGDV